MAALDFPASPANGQTFSSNGVVYVWNGYAWDGGPVAGMGDGVGLTDGDKGDVVVSNLGLTWNLDDNAVAARFARLDSPAFIGGPTAPTRTTADNSTGIATTAFVKANLGNYLPVAGGHLTGYLYLDALTLYYNAAGSAYQQFANSLHNFSHTISAPAFVSSAHVTVGNGVIYLNGAASVYLQWVGAENRMWLSSGRLDVGGGAHFGAQVRIGADTALSGFGTQAELNFAGGNTEFGLLFRPALDNSYMCIFHNSSNTQSGSIIVSGPGTGAATQYNTTSDGRLKDRIEDHRPDPGLFDRLRVRSFRWKGHPDYPVHGFIAQELYDAGAPHAVTPGIEHECPDGKIVEIPWQHDLSKLIPDIVAEMQAMRERIADLEAQLATPRKMH